jgi:hypothetical protein
VNVFFVPLQAIVLVFMRMNFFESSQSIVLVRMRMFSLFPYSHSFGSIENVFFVPLQAIVLVLMRMFSLNPHSPWFWFS